MAIEVQAWNTATGVYETIDCEPGGHSELIEAELSATDLGCEPGTVYRLQQVDDDDDHVVVNERYVTAV